MTAVFALPYAFGSASVYRGFKEYLNRDIDFFPLEYAGHSSRFNEPLYTSIQEMAIDAYNWIRDKASRYDSYMIMGYSMGSLVGFELYRYLVKNNQKPPECFLAFASAAPDRVYKYKSYEEYGINEIREELCEQHGTPKEILDNPEMLELFMPIIKSDLIALRDYCPGDLSDKIRCRTVIVRGTEEESDGCNENWNRFCENESELFLMEGGHFFMFENEDVTKKCAELVNGLVNRL